MLYFGMKILWLKPGAKLDHLDCIQNEVKTQFQLIVVSFFLNTFVRRSWG